MPTLRLTGKADVGIIYDAEKLRYSAEDFARLNLTREQMIAFYADCPTVGYECDGVPIGGAIFHNNELHLAVMPAYYGRWTWLLKPTLDWMFKMCDPVYVQVEKNNPRCLRFMEQGNWPRAREDEHKVIFELSSANPLFRRSRVRQARAAT